MYELDSAGNQTVLLPFTGADGGNPNGLTRDSAGNLYATTNSGGDFGTGILYELDTAGHLAVLHGFDSVTYLGPFAGVIMDQAAVSMRLRIAEASTDVPAV